MMTRDSIGATLEQRRLELRAARLRAALLRLQRIAEETAAAGRQVPLALRSAERTFSEELADVVSALDRLDASAPRAEGA